MASCKLPEEKAAERFAEIADTMEIQTTDSNNAIVTAMEDKPIPHVQKIKNPVGVYTTTLLLDDVIEHTVAFYNNNTFQLQEKYANDSVVTIKGNWSPSNGYIWLYKDQIVRARYVWNGDDLHYFNPLVKKNFKMQHLQSAIQNQVWQNKKSQGILFFGIGNEPFWSVEVNNKDSVSFLLAEWTKPLTLKLNAVNNNNGDSVVYSGKSDTSFIRLTIFPYFCSDGMSDFVYNNKVRVQYNNQVYSGCGHLYK